MSTTRLLAALNTIHDHLHAGRVNDAHAACECALGGGEVAPMNITGDEAARCMQFVAEFNALAQRYALPAATFIPLQSKTVPGAVSLQLGGNVASCKLLEEIMGKKSTYREVP